MIKKLRVKFIAIIMASVAAVLVVVFTGICITEYQRSMSTVESALFNAVNRASEGEFGMHGPDMSSSSSNGMVPPAAGQDSVQGEWSPDDLEAGYSDEDVAQTEAERQGLKPYGREDGSYEGAGEQTARGQTGADFAGPRIGGMGDGERSLVPVAVYEVTESSELQIVSSFTTATIDDDVLQAASERIGEFQDGSGTMADLGLHYQKRTTDTTTYIAFADTASSSGWQSLALTLTVAALIVLAVFFVIALLLSRWALRPVQEAWDSQRQFVADASHELKTPLTVVLANTSILLKHPEKSIAQQSQWIESTQIEAENMQGLVNEMLELAQVESRTNVQHVPLDFSDLVDGEVLQFESVAFERGCMMADDVREGVQVEGDAQRLRKMTSTLIENALKYVDDGGLVCVGLKVQGKTAQLSIRNTGSVISPEDLPHIFDRFYRTDKARTSGTGGFGLGLAIAREIAREHNGDITCQSDAQSGTTFTVTLPICPLPK